MPGSVRVLVVDDSALMRKAIKGMLTAAGFEVETARNGADALEQVQRLRPDVVTLDINMPEMDGMTCLAQLMANDPLPVVMVSSLTDAGAKITFEALELGAVDYVCKPGGTVSLDIDTVEKDLVAKVRSAARAKVRRAGGLRERLVRQRELSEQRSTTTGSADRGSTRTLTRADPSAPARPVRPRSRATLGVVPDLVLIGSSTGGPSALTTVLTSLPRDFGAPVVIAQHIPASFTKHLAMRLDEQCRVEVVELFATEVLRPGCVYLGRGDADVVINKRGDEIVARSVPASAEYRWHPSVDRMVGSALNCGLDPTRLVGVLLTGMGDDGAAEMSRIKQQGGRTIAESEQTAVVFGMPGDLVKRGGAGLVLPLDDIGDQLACWG